MTGPIRQIRTNTGPGQTDKLRMTLDEVPARRHSFWFWLLVAASVLLAFAAVYMRHDMMAALKPKPGAPLSLSATQVQVVDSDTIRLNGQQGDIRLVGLNTPQAARARCDAERERGYLTMRRLRALVESSELALQPVPCACPPNTEGTEACNANKRCGILRANGWDVSERLIAEGLATRMSCTADGCQASVNKWCDAR
jgi:endonuclease YncB( thermonuclease family)